VHGTGGGHYDFFTNQFIRAWWNVEPTPFSVASASRYLFDQERQQLSRLQKISDNLRDYQFNPQRYLGTDVFSSDTETALRTTLAEKESAVTALRTARESGLPADDIGRKIQRLGDLIKWTVSSEFSAQLTQLQSLSNETMAAVNSRTWPWFYFA
jgi:exonuclease VII large subunit